MSNLQNDKDVLEKRNGLKDDKEAGLKVTASLRDQVQDKLVKKLEDKQVGKKIVEMWAKGNSDRAEWLKRQESYLEEVDEFIEPIYPQALEWSSAIHLPTILTIGKTFHARMLSALIGVDPMFTARARKGANADRALLVEELMRYTLRDWCNEYDGIEGQLDKWVWDWCMRGVGLLKARWHKKFTRFVDVESEMVQEVDLDIDESTGDSKPVPVMREVEKEVVKTEEVFNGPMLECVPIEDVIIVGGNGDPQRADAVLHRADYTASELWSFADQKLFRSVAVEAAVQSGPDPMIGTDETSAIKQAQKTHGGMTTAESDNAIDRYKVIEAYIKLDVDNSGIASDLIVWVHERSKEILRATYLRRVNRVGTVPIFKIDFHHRHGTEYSVGLIELLYSLAKEIDAMHNINVDIGILSSMPIGFYRPTASSLKDNRLPLEPGSLIPVDNPQTDIMFPNLGLRTSFGFQEQQALQVQIERLTSISDLNLGIVGGQGATRTATGTRALLGESSNNLDVYIKRMHRGWRRAIRYMFAMLQDRLPPNFQFRILGDDGNQYWQQIESREEIAGMYDFELEANSANSNKQVQIEQANMIYQMTQNPIDLQLGIVSPVNRYEALIYQLKVNGIKDVAKYATKPQGFDIQFSPLEIADRILAGVDVRLGPTQDLQGFIELVKQMVEDDTINGQFSSQQLAALVAKAQEAQGMLEAIQSAQGASMAANQQQMNTQAAMQPSNQQPVAVNQTPMNGEGGAA